MWGAGALPEKSDWDPLGPAPRLLQPRSAQQPRAVRRRTDADAFAPEPKQQQQGRGFAAAPQQARARGSDANLPAPQRQQQYQQVYEPAHQPSTSYTDAGYEDAEFWPGPANGAPAFPGAQRDHGFGDILARGDGAGAAAADAAAGEGFPQAAGGPAGRPRPGVGVVQPISVLAALYQGATLGLAVYDGLSSEISILQCHDEIKGPLAFQMLALAKAQVVPQVLLLSARAEPAAVEAARAALPPGTGAEAVAAEGAPEGGAGAGPAARPEVRLERSATFGFDNARKRLPRALLLRSWPPGLSGREAAVRLAACVDLGQQAAVGALGALLAYMLREGISTQGGYGGGGGGGGEGAYGEEGEEGGGAGGSTAGAAVVVDRLSQLTMQGLLHVDLPTLYGLQVFAVEKHPSAMGLGKPKEGFSLYGLANRCVTQMGRRLLRLWFLRPVVNLEVISDRQDIIELLLRNGGELVGPLRAELKKLPDVASLLSRLTAAQQRPDLAAMQQLQNCLLQLLRLRAIFAQQLAPGLAAAAAAAAAGGRAWEAPSPAPSGATDAGGGLRWEAVSLSAKVLAHVPESLQEALDLVRSVLDPDQDEDGLMVAAEVCPALDRLKAAYRALPQHLTQASDGVAHVINKAVVESELRRVPRCLVRPNLQQLWSVLYLPQVGFVLKVQGAQLTADLLDALPDYELAFEGAAGPEEAEPGAAEGAGSVGAAGGQGAGWAAYYRTQSTLDLNARFGDLRYKIQDLESSLIAELMARLLEEHGPVMQRAAAVAGELDCLLSLAALAAERGYRRPLLTEGTGLRIVNGRHPLAEMVVEPYIPFSTAMEEGGEAVAAAAAAALGGSGHAASGSGGGPDGLGGRLQVVTGPNASGKSCYARAVALIAFLAHVGSFVPADEAEIGRADRIAARLAAPSGGAAVLLGAAGAGGGAGGGGAAADGGGGGGGLTGGGALRPSTFLADLTQVSAMLRNATHRSLLVLDEFGKVRRGGRGAAAGTRRFG
ncbi:hypothetical protein HYH03_004869 [Edaphochlamys debaryana]|uniref:Uncharacterized protein n=1 Tax=Edaphochlamys debaryana TaxID=47281 RepID=A0A835YAK6_9CHLO|nr:hypothetical protein HYH03_004869 [Edaphochlamys debaryana]|eukprot:KAG2497286.1 hypothetical protein HYH03_004869 [Edaphochlamys debaryana]